MNMVKEKAAAVPAHLEVQNEQFYLRLIETGCNKNAHLRHRATFFAQGLPFYTYAGNADQNDSIYLKEFSDGAVHLVKREVQADLTVKETFLKVLRSAAA